MAPFNTPLMSMTAKMLLLARMKKIPIKWKAPGPQFPKAFKPSELMVPPNIPVPPFEFREPTLNKYHVDTARTIGMAYANYIDGICTAIGTGITMWKTAAFFKSVKVMAACAIGTPGCVSGPPIGPPIFAAAPKAKPQEIKYSKAISNAVGKQWQKWADKIIVPGLPWYPAFIAFPGPMAPPMPNIPMPLIACPSPMMAELMAPRLKQVMISELGDKKALHHKELFESLAIAFQMVFMIWVATQMVMLAMGTGPIPTFAPPYVPVGPVLNGQVLPTPGVFAT